MPASATEGPAEGRATENNPTGNKGHMRGVLHVEDEVHMECMTPQSKKEIFCSDRDCDGLFKRKLKGKRKLSLII